MKREEDKSILELLKDDYHRIINFLNEKRKYIFWIIVLFITLSTTDVLSLGAAWDNISNQNPQFKLRQMSGGGDGEDGGNTSSNSDSKTNATETKESEDSQVKFKKKSKQEKKQEKKEQKEQKKQEKQDKKKQDGEEAKQSDRPDISGKQKEIDQMKKSRPKRRGAGGSPLGQMSSQIFTIFGKAFTLFATILMIAGILSLPFLLVIIGTYYIIKMIAKHFMMY